MKEVIDEAISNSDGGKRQDCEIEAGKGMIRKIRRAHPKLKIKLQKVFL